MHITSYEDVFLTLAMAQNYPEAIDPMISFEFHQYGTLYDTLQLELLHYLVV